MGKLNRLNAKINDLEKRTDAIRQSAMHGAGVQYTNDYVNLYSPPRPVIKPEGQGGGAWSPDLWKPTIASLSVVGTNPPVYKSTVLSVDNAMIMAGRLFYNFGSIEPQAHLVLSGAVFAIFQHPVWNNDYTSMRCYLSCAPTIDAAMNYSDNYSVLPLYFVNPDVPEISVDYRGIPTITMYS